MTADKAWETTPPHTLSVLKLDQGGYAYWGWYGLVLYPNGGPIGLARSNDLTTWDKNADPVIASGRWPSVVKIGSTLYMAVTYYNPATELQSIRLMSSADGVAWTLVKTLVAEEAGKSSDGSHLFINPNDNRVYFYWVDRGYPTGTYHKILCRSATDITTLEVAETVSVKESVATLASPSVMFRDGRYFLAVETQPASTWLTNVYSSRYPTTGFEEIYGSPILTSNEACFIQHIFGDTLFAPNGHLVGETWHLDARTADLSGGRIVP